MAVRKHGQMIGFYIPVERDEEQSKRAMTRFGQTKVVCPGVARVL